MREGVGNLVAGPSVAEVEGWVRDRERSGIPEIADDLGGVTNHPMTGNADAKSVALLLKSFGE